MKKLGKLDQIKAEAEKALTHSGCDHAAPLVKELATRVLALVELVEAKDALLVAYRLGDRRRADNALTKHEDALAKLE
jgi:hypothetical protein